MEKVTVSVSEVKEDAVVKKTSTKSKPKEKEKQRSGKRMEEHRATTSQRNDSNAKQALYEKLYYGFNRQQHEAMKSMHIVTTPRSIILPISTRSVGFMIRFLICKFARLGIKNVDFHGLCSALYRVSLLQIEIKLMMTMRNQFSRNIGDDFVSFDIDSDFVNCVVNQLRAYFSPLVNLISSVGLVEAFGAVFIPCMVNALTFEQIRGYDPTIITYSTLRDYVSAMSTNVTPYRVRKYFYDHCPMPNARWQLQARVQENYVDKSFPILTNADEIMPIQYTLGSLHSDINIIMDAIELIGRKYEKFVHVGGIDYSGNGNYTIFPSNNVEEDKDIRCSDLTWIGENAIYANATPLTGNIDHFWSSESISDAEFYLGSIHLFGERPRLGTISSAFDIRSPSVAKQKASIDYTAGLQNLFG